MQALPVHDLFAAENAALLAAKSAHSAGGQGGQALGELIIAFERLLRETRRLVRRSDKAELEMNQLNLRLQYLAAELEHRANHDPLTGVLNRAAIIDLVNRHFAQQDLALIVLDIDHFKRINDSFGHPTGDR
jgi:PleD family two-component response regulator